MHFTLVREENNALSVQNKHSLKSTLVISYAIQYL